MHFTHAVRHLGTGLIGVDQESSSSRFSNNSEHLLVLLRSLCVNAGGLFTFSAFNIRYGNCQVFGSLINECISSKPSSSPEIREDSPAESDRE